MVTFAVGCELSTMVNVAVPPARFRSSSNPSSGVTLMPAASLSVFVTATSAALKPL